MLFSNGTRNLCVNTPENVVDQRKSYGRRRQTTSEAEMGAFVLEEWDRMPQKWIHELIDRQEHYVHVFFQRWGWSTPN